MSVYDVFIEYQNTKPDRIIARRLYYELKHYRAPHNVAAIHEHNRIKGIFMDTSDFADTSDLREEVLHAIRKSRYLIVLCSTNTKNSQRTKRLIDIFNENSFGIHVLILLISGEPKESFPDILRYERKKIWQTYEKKYTETVEEVEPLAGDIRSDRLSSSLKLLKYEKLRLIAPILNKSFDALRQRQRERTVHKIKLAAACVLLVAIMVSALSFIGWRNADRQQKEMEAAKSEVARENEIAKKQAELAKQAVIRMYKDIPGKFSAISGAKPVIDEILTKDIRSIPGADAAIDEIFKEYPELKGTYGEQP